MQFLHYNPLSSRVEIAEALTNAPNERTLKRIIAECVQKGDIVVEGKGKATRYSLSAQVHLMMPLDIETYFMNDVDERLVQESFNFQLICEILPKVTLFTAEEKARLDAAHKDFLANMSTLSDVEYRKEMEGIYTTCVDRTTLDEAPMAYKGIDEIISHIGPTVDIVERITPVYNFKAAE